MASELSVEPRLPRACRRWQTGRDGGSSLLRGAARVITRIPHYFDLPFIHVYEDRARADLSALEDAHALLDALAAAPALQATGWATHVGVRQVDPFAGRGLQSGQQDDQILERLSTGTIDMPLWGVSLDRAIATGYGTRFLFELAGPFPAIAAWTWSGIKAGELELITGGRYAVHKPEDRDGTTHATLEWTSVLSTASGSGPVDQQVS